MNIASLFSSYRLLAAELDRARSELSAVRQTLDTERRRFIDTIRRDSGKQPIYSEPTVPKRQTLAPAMGSYGARVQDAERETRKEETQTGRPRPISLPPAVGATGARQRDAELEKLAKAETVPMVASDEEIREAAEGLRESVA